MGIEYIIALAVSIVLALIGVLYKGVTGNIKDNSLNIEKLDDKVDARLDDAEKEIAIIKTKIEK